MGKFPKQENAVPEIESMKVDFVTLPSGLYLMLVHQGVEKQNLKVFKD